MGLSQKRKAMGMNKCNGKCQWRKKNEEYVPNWYKSILVIRTQICKHKYDVEKNNIDLKRHLSIPLY
jgi:hypothetical protein